MTHILKELSKRNMHIPYIALFNEDKWHKRSPKDDFGAFRGGGHFWRVTLLPRKTYILVPIARLCNIMATNNFSLLLHIVKGIVG